MDDKQLNFFQPLLSVRRFPSTVSSQKDEKRKTDLSQSQVPVIPSYKSELKSGPIRNAGTVPFVWERSPGRPKDDNIPQKFVERPPVAPKLPPGRILQTTKEDSDKIPEQLSLSKRHREVLNGSPSVSPAYQNVTEQETSKDTTEVESSDSGEGDEAYMDALDTLSRTESSFMNCSVSGISGLDGLGVNTSGTFSTDPQTRDFMMGRFLPAAKAMTSETPHYAPKKQPLVREQPTRMIKVTDGDKQSPLRYGLNVTPHCAQEKDGESDDDYDGHGQFPAHICGLLPRFFLKSSLGLSNPVAGMSVRSRVPMSPGSKTYGSSSSTGSSCENENEAQVDQLSCSFNPQKLEGSSLYRRLQGKGMPSTHNELPRPAFSVQKEFLPVPGYSSLEKGRSPFEKVPSDPISNGELETGSNMIEKTLYVDIVHKVESPSINSYISNKTDVENHFNLKDMEVPLKESSVVLCEDQNVEAEETNLKVISQKLVALSVPAVADKSNQVSVLNTLAGFGQNDDFSNFENAEAPMNGYKTFKSQQPPKAEYLENSKGSQELPVPPPLPKSPSDSWLWRTLPSKSSRNPSTQSNLGPVIHPGNQSSKNSYGHIE